jgi:signal peptidase II
MQEATPPIDANSQPKGTPAGSLFSRYRVLLVNSGAAIIADQLTKRMIEAQLPLYESIPLIGQYFGFTHTKNYGAAFSMLQNGGAFFIVVALIVSAIILYYTPRLPEGDWLSRVALGLQMGGALGNVIDRLRQGYVTDFLHFQVPEIDFNFPVFNMADSCIFVGVVILIATSFVRDRRAAQSAHAGE